MEKEELSPADAAAVVEADKKARCEQAAQELAALCERMNVNIVAVTQIAGGQISQAIHFVPR